MSGYWEYRSLLDTLHLLDLVSDETWHSAEQCISWSDLRDEQHYMTLMYVLYRLDLISIATFIST